MFGKIITPGQILQPKIEMKITVDPATGQTALDTGRKSLDTFFVMNVLLSIAMGLLQEIRNQASMIVGQKGKADSNGEENNDEN